MLLTRLPETEQSPWSRKLETAFHKSTGLRMSSYDGSLSTQPDWQGHYSFLPPGESNIFGQPFEQVANSNNDNETTSQQRPSSIQNSNLDTRGQTSSSALNSPTNRQRVLDPLGLRQPKAEPASQDQPSVSGNSYTIKTEAVQEESLASTETVQLTIETNLPISVPSANQDPRASLDVGANEETVLGKEEDDEVVDDDDMIEGDGEGDGEDETPSQPQTAAERTAARRKMKRFR